MALTDIISRIQEDAGREAAALKKATDEAVHRIITECDRECEALLGAAREEGARQASDNRNRLLVEARLASRRERLEGRADLMRRVFQRVREEIVKDRERYLTFLAAQIEQAADQGNEKVIFSSGDHTAFGDELQPLVARINERLQAADRRGELVLTGEKGAFDGGFILRRGRTSTIMTMDTIIGVLRDRHEADVARVLAGEDL
ncbi:MAG: V-type ATP synthase subunit E [Planctomycetota bacterium]